MELARRIGPVDRYWLCQEYRELAATAIRMRHPSAAWLARHEPEALRDGVLAEAVLKLKAWVADRPPLPIDPDSHTARHGD